MGVGVVEAEKWVKKQFHKVKQIVNSLLSDTCLRKSQTLMGGEFVSSTNSKRSTFLLLSLKVLLLSPGAS